jgi:hypothetical protein
MMPTNGGMWLGRVVVAVEDGDIRCGANPA